MCVSVEVIKETSEIEGTFTSSDDVVKSKPSQATLPSGEDLVTWSYINQHIFVCVWLS